MIWNVMKSEHKTLPFLSLLAITLLVPCKFWIDKQLQTLRSEIMLWTFLTYYKHTNQR